MPIIGSGKGLGMGSCKKKLQGTPCGLFWGRFRQDFSWFFSAVKGNFVVAGDSRHFQGFCWCINSRSEKCVNLLKYHPLKNQKP